MPKINRHALRQAFRTKILITKDGKLSIKGLRFHDGESVEGMVRRAAKYPLRGKPVIYRDPFKAASSDWEAM